jgi:hypothetical protein
MSERLRQVPALLRGHLRQEDRLVRSLFQDDPVPAGDDVLIGGDGCGWGEDGNFYLDRRKLVRLYRAETRVTGCRVDGVLLDRLVEGFDGSDVSDTARSFP